MRGAERETDYEIVDAQCGTEEGRTRLSVSEGRLLADELRDRDQDQREALRSEDGRSLVTTTVQAGVLPSRHDEAAHRSAAHRALTYSALGLGVAGGVELALAGFTHSVGLLGDALHNISDVSTSVLVFLGFWISKRPTTDRHPYGYERAEDIAGIGVALAIWASAAFAGIESANKLIRHTSTVHLGWGMAGAVVGILGNQAVAWYKGSVGRRIQSATLTADARHSWLDALSSLGALVGLVFVALGYRLGDPVAGFAITVMICHVGYEVTTEIVSRLMDGIDPVLLERATQAARKVPQVRVVGVRGRWSGRTLRLDIRAAIDPTMTLAATPPVVLAVEAAVLAAVEEARVVEVSVVPDSDPTRGRSALP